MEGIHLPFSAGTEYVAFSLTAAQMIIAASPERQLPAEVFNLAGMTVVRGMVYDRENNDIILVGERNLNRTVLTLDDFVVALRARFIHGIWPLVSIDPTPETKKTEIQIVRFEGGIEDTQFGEDLFDADFRLKKIHMGLLPSGIPGLKTYWDLLIERSKENPVRNFEICGRFWFYPVLPNVSLREDVVTIKGLKVGVFSEVLSAEIDEKKIENLSTFQDGAGNIFAKVVSDNFEGLSNVHPSFSRVQGLSELVALTKAIEEMDNRPDLTYYLKEYQVEYVRTKREVKVLKRSEEYKLRGEVYNGYLELSGGVQLLAIAMRLRAGDVTALREAVLKTRPKPGTLNWGFVVGEWLIPLSSAMLKVEDVVPLFTQAVFLQEKKYYDDAITLYGKILELKPDWDRAYNNRGINYWYKGLYNQAISDFNKALEINSKNTEAWVNKGATLGKLGKYQEEIYCCDKALDMNPEFAEAWNNRGFALNGLDKKQEAILCFGKALNVNPKLTEALHGKGSALSSLGRYQEAISCFDKALELNPQDTEAWHNKGVALGKLGRYEEGLFCSDKALEINPNLVEVWHSKGVALNNLDNYQEALPCYDRALTINPKFAEAWLGKGAALGKLGKNKEAITCYDKALEVNSKYTDAWVNKGATLSLLGSHQEAIYSYDKALEINPKYAGAWVGKSASLYALGRYQEALDCAQEAIILEPNNSGAYRLEQTLLQVFKK